MQTIKTNRPNSSPSWKQWIIAWMVAIGLFGAMAMGIKYEKQQKNSQRVESENLEIQKWNDFVAANNCKLIAKKDVGAQEKVEYSYLCEDGVTYTKMLAH